MVKRIVKMEVMNRIVLARIELKLLGFVMVILIVRKVKMKLDVLVILIIFGIQSSVKCFFLYVQKKGCAADEFSCNDWNTRYKRSTCIPLEQRCDGIEQCPVGFDEIDCTVLTDTLEEPNKVCKETMSILKFFNNIFSQLIKVSNAVGFLNRNYKGKWYPTCLGTEIWAEEVCKTESGPNPHHL